MKPGTMEKINTPEVSLSIKEMLQDFESHSNSHFIAIPKIMKCKDKRKKKK